MRDGKIFIIPIENVIRMRNGRNGSRRHLGGVVSKGTQYDVLILDEGNDAHRPVASFDRLGAGKRIYFIDLLYLVLPLLQEPHLHVGVLSQQHPDRVIVVEKPYSELQV